MMRPMGRFPRCLVLEFCLLIVFSGAAFAQQADRVTAAIDARKTELADHVPGWAVGSRDLGPAAAGLTLDSLRLTLTRSSEREAAFQQRLLDQQNPASPRYHQWLTPQQIGEQFGPSEHDIAAVTGWLQSQRFVVDRVANSRMLVVFHGTAAQVEDAFGVALHEFSSSDGPRLSISGAPKIPTALAAVIQSIEGLSQHVLRPASHARPEYSPCYGSVCYHYVAPGDFATIYDINSVYSANIKGAGQTIAIVGRAQVYSPDITEYEANTGLPTETPALIVPPEGVTPPAPNDSTTQTPNDDQTEATLDVQRSFGTAPGASVDLVASLSTQTEDGIDIAKDYVIDNASALHTSILTNSFGECEADVAASAVSANDTLFQQGAAEGLTILGISGDSGAAGCDAYNSTPPAQQVKSPNYLCSSSYVTCMGGTEFNDTADPATYWSANSSTALESALSYIPEGAWNEPESGGDFYAQATGGGVSSVAATPYWQTGTGVPGHAGRYTPDISFTSSEHDAYYGCYAAGGGDCSLSYFEYFYGTSAAAPSMAGVVALLNQKLGKAQGNLNPVLYALAAAPAKKVFHDATVATSGVTNCAAATPSLCNNSTPAPASLTGGLAGYTLNAGYDLATGWGSTDVANLLSNWTTGGPSATATALTVSPSDSFALGTVAKLTAKVTGSVTISAGSVTFFAGGSALATVPVTNGSATLTAPTVGLAPGSYAVQAKYSGTATQVPSNSAMVTVKLTAAASATALTASPSTVTPPGNVTLAATVTSGDGTPAGSVSFYEGSTGLGSKTLAGGKASLTASTAGLPAGKFSVKAVYSGTADILTSSSGTVTVTVK
jgi:subtilase family serine protease